MLCVHAWADVGIFCIFLTPETATIYINYQARTLCVFNECHGPVKNAI